MNVHVFVEGKKSTECRKAFRLFLEKLVGERHRLKILACGSRNEAYKDFCRSLQYDRVALAIRLIDSEGPVPPGKSPCAHLRDCGWTNPMPDQQVHLMVQCMESWFLADRAQLERYYGQDFNAGALPRNPNVEEIPKEDLLRALQQATKGTYHKTRHGFEILERIDPAKVRAHAPHAERFFDFLLSKLT